MKRAAWPLAAVAGVALLVVGLLPRQPDADRSWMAPATTYSPGPQGSKALFLLLGQLGLDVQRLRRPDYEHLTPGSVLWVLAREPFGRAERRGLILFLRRGGTLIAPPRALAAVLEEADLGGPGKPRVLERRGPVSTSWGTALELEGAPASLEGAARPTEVYASAAGGEPVVAVWRIGEGRAVSLGVDQAARNGRIGLGGNGPFLAKLAFLLGRRHVFDEYKTGFGEGNLLTLAARLPYRWGLLQLALVGALALVSFARRRLPAEPPDPLRRRRTVDHVEAVARLWERGRDAGLPLRALLNAAAERARLRLGGASGGRPFVEWIARVRPDLASRAAASWEGAERLCDYTRPTLDEARRAAEDVKALEGEGLKW